MNNQLPNSNLRNDFKMIGVWLLVIFLSSGCGNSGNKIVAVVNGQVITQRQLDDRMAKMKSSYRQALGNDQNRLLEQMVMEQVLLQEARRRGLERDTEVQNLLREAQKQIVLGRLLEVIRDSEKGNVTDQELARFYEANKSKFTAPETVRASHILVEKEETAHKALERLKAGEPFDKVAKEFSLDSSKEKGGDVGYFAKGQLIPEFEAACEKLKVGELSSVVKTSLGYHIILLTERRAAGQESLEDVKEQLQHQLTAQRQQQKTEALIKELRNKAQIRYVPPFHEPMLSMAQKTQESSPSAQPAGSAPSKTASR